MFSFASPAGRWPLALMLAACAACADEPVAPKKLSMPMPNASSATDVVMVTNKSGGTDVGSLRWAVSSGVGATIQFDPSLAGDTISVDATVVVNQNKIIEGPADKGITISGRYYNGRVFQVPAGASLRLRNLTITGGGADQGSAILAEGSTYDGLVLEHTTVRGNRGNSGAIYGTYVKLINSTVSGNTGDFTSGITYTGGLELNNSTVAANGPGPGIRSYGPYYSPPSAHLRNSIIASNGVPLRNCSDTVRVYHTGANISNDTSCGTSPNMIVASPQLYSLANTGGPTMTHGLAFDSPAINAGVYCDRPVDQRYVSHDAKCDIGAFEFTDFTVVTLTVDANLNVDPTSGAANITGTVRCTRPGAIPLGVQLNQTQKTGKTSTTVVRGNGAASVSCTTSAQPWSITAAPWSGAFQNGSAAATAFTNNAPIWVTPASVDKAVKLIRRR